MDDDACARQIQDTMQYIARKSRLKCLFFAASFSAPPLEVEQVPDGEQATARAAGEERHARLPGRGRQRGLLVLHLPLLQAQVQRGQRGRRRQGERGSAVKVDFRRRVPPSRSKELPRLLNGLSVDVSVAIVATALNVSV